MQHYFEDPAVFPNGSTSISLTNQTIFCDRKFHYFHFYLSIHQFENGQTHHELALQSHQLYSHLLCLYLFLCFFSLHKFIWIKCNSKECSITKHWLTLFFSTFYFVKISNAFSDALTVARQSYIVTYIKFVVILVFVVVFFFYSTTFEQMRAFILLRSRVCLFCSEFVAAGNGGGGDDDGVLEKRK